MLGCLHKRRSLLLCDVVIDAGVVDAGDGGDDGLHGRGVELSKHIFQLLVFIFLENADESGVQLLFGDGWLEVDPGFEGLFPKGRIGYLFADFGAHGQHDGTGDAEMGEHHLAEFAEDFFFAFPDDQLDVLERQALHGPAVLFRAADGHQGGIAVCQMKTCLLGEAIAVSGGAGRGVTDAACRDDDAVSVHRFYSIKSGLITRI